MKTYRKREFSRLQIARRSEGLPSSSLPGASRSIAFPNNRSPLTSYNLEPSSTAWPTFVLPVASSRSRRHEFFWHSIFEAGLASKDQRFRYTYGINIFARTTFLRKSSQSHPAAPTHISTPQSNARHVPKHGQARRRPWEPPGSNVLFCLNFVSMTLRQEGAASGLFLRELLSSYQASGVEVHNLSPSTSPPRSSRTEEMARWRWYSLVWRFCRWEVSHQRLLLCAFWKMGNTTWATQRRFRPKRLPCQGDWEDRPSSRNWSSWSLGRVQPSEQKSYPHASLVLL